MDQQWDRIRQFSTGDACPSTNSLLDSAEMLQKGDRRRNGKSGRGQEDVASTHSTLSSLEQMFHAQMDEQRFAFESLVKANSQRLNQVTDQIVGELRKERELREVMEERLNGLQDATLHEKVPLRTLRTQYLCDLQGDLRRHEVALKRDIEGSRAAIEMLVLVGGTRGEQIDVKVQKLIDIRQDTIDRVDKDLYAVEGRLQEIADELAHLAPISD